MFSGIWVGIAMMVQVMGNSSMNQMTGPEQTLKTIPSTNFLKKIISSNDLCTPLRIYLFYRQPTWIKKDNS